jgi:hypothetical protein
MTDHINVEREFPGPYWYLGKVINRDDPEGRYRIKASIPGRTTETDWAVPLGLALGQKRGGGQVPDKGAPVVLFWLGGDIKGIVVYLPAWLFDGWIPTGHVINEDGGDNFVWQNDKIRVEVDTRDSSAGLRVTNLDETGGTDAAGTAVAIDVDTVTKQVAITTDLGIKIESTGAVRINGGAITLNGRLVSPGSKPL